MFGIPFGRVLIASAIAGIIGISSVLVLPHDKATATLSVVPSKTAYSIGDTFTVPVVAESSEPVNVFKGMIRFDSTVLEVLSINYNTSFLDLWAEEPWYSNGEGTLNFIGGTTKQGGFTGTDTVLSITFRAKSIGTTPLSIEDIRILKHDGLGTDVLVEEPIDTIFSVTEAPPTKEIIVTKEAKSRTLRVLPQNVSTDLNHDGKQTIADISIFMKHLVTGDLVADFNQDGSVDLADLSILMQE